MSNTKLTRLSCYTCFLYSGPTTPDLSYKVWVSDSNLIGINRPFSNNDVKMPSTNPMYNRVKCVTTTPGGSGVWDKVMQTPETSSVTQQKLCWGQATMPLDAKVGPHTILYHFWRDDSVNKDWLSCEYVNVVAAGTKTQASGFVEVDDGLNFTPGSYNSKETALGGAPGGSGWDALKQIKTFDKATINYKGKPVDAAAAVKGLVTATKIGAAPLPAASGVTAMTGNSTAQSSDPEGEDDDDDPETKPKTTKGKKGQQDQQAQKPQCRSNNGTKKKCKNLKTVFAQTQPVVAPTPTPTPTSIVAPTPIVTPKPVVTPTATPKPVSTLVVTPAPAPVPVTTTPASNACIVTLNGVKWNATKYNVVHPGGSFTDLALCGTDITDGCKDNHGSRCDKMAARKLIKV